MSKIKAGSGEELGWDDIIKEFVALVVKSPIALITVVLSFLLGYGISFILFDYRRAPVHKSHYLWHVLIGLGYTALIFIIINFDIICKAFSLKTLSIDELIARMPLTLLISFALAFLIMIFGAVWRERRAPYAADSQE